MSRTHLALLLLVLITLVGCTGGETASTDKTPSDSESLLPTGFAAEPVPYNSVFQLSDVNGTLTFIGKNDTGSFIVHGDTVIAHAPTITQYRYHDGNWAYITGDEQERYIHIDGEKKGPYDTVYPPVWARESWTYGTISDGVGHIFYKGNEVGQKYRIVSPDYVVVDEKLAYSALGSSTNETIIVHDASEVTRGQDIEPFIESVNDKLLYARKEIRWNGTRAEHGNVTLVHGRRHIPTGYPITRGYTGINNSLYYIASDIKGGEYVHSYPEGKRYGPYDKVKRILSVQDRPALVISEDGKNRIVYRNRTYGGAYDYVKPSSVSSVNGTVVYYAVPESGGVLSSANSVIVYGETEIGEKYKSKTGITAVDGKLVFAAKHDGQTFFIREQ